MEATHYGDSYDLSCTVESYPATFAEIRDASGIRVHKQIVKTLEPFKTLAFAVVPDAEEMDYVCHVGVHYGGQLVSQEEKKLHIQIYGTHTSVHIEGSMHGTTEGVLVWV